MILGSGCVGNLKRPGTVDVVGYPNRQYEVLRYAEDGVYDIVARVSEKWMADLLAKELRQRLRKKR